MKKLLTIMGLILLIVIPKVSFTQDSSTVDQNSRSLEKAKLKEQKKVERNTNAFNPAYFTSNENKHYALRLRINDSNLEPLNVETRIGNMPHRSDKSGQVAINYYDADNNLLGTYYEQDPTVIRVCDQNVGVRPLQNGSIIEILLPPDRNISRIAVSGTQMRQDTISLNIGDLIKRAQ